MYEETNIREAGGIIPRTAGVIRGAGRMIRCVSRNTIRGRGMIREHRGMIPAARRTPSCAGRVILPPAGMLQAGGIVFQECSVVFQKVGSVFQGPVVSYFEISPPAGAASFL